jgi:NAD(P)-dependent dehydrogenase (short-subunit alcohol dehydrogenase family)
MDISHSTWLITGASSGLGLETARQLLAAGARVAATVRRTR